MFQYFSSYLRGSVANQADGAADSAVEGVENGSLRLTSVDAEDEWVLVDRDSDGNSDFSSVESLNEDDDDLGAAAEADLFQAIALPALLTRTSSTSSLPCTSSGMEESWFITPPPCFISTGPVHMATSPLENLLIEHPSMSVYVHHQRRCGYLEDGSGDRAAAPVDQPPRMGVLDYFPDRHAERQRQLELEWREAALQDRLDRQVVRNKQAEVARQAQKVQIQMACKSFKRGHLDRNNKAREVNGRNRRQRRGERSQGATRSHANNNRKC